MSGKEIRFGPYFALPPASRCKYYLPTVEIFNDSKFRINNFVCYNKVIDSQVERSSISIIMLDIIITFFGTRNGKFHRSITVVILTTILDIVNFQLYELMFS